MELESGDDPIEIAEDVLSRYYPPVPDDWFKRGPQYPADHISNIASCDGGPQRRSEFVPRDPYAAENARIAAERKEFHDMLERQRSEAAALAEQWRIALERQVRLPAPQLSRICSRNRKQPGRIPEPLAA